jgi:hypothetical protein
VIPRAIVWLEGLGKLKKINYLIGNRSRDLSACSIVAINYATALKYDVQKYNKITWTGFIWLKTETSERCFKLQKRERIS